ASALISDLLRWSVLGSVTLVIILTAGSISSERGTLADSVLSRGISRYQYFLGKWHARLVVVLTTFLVMGLAALTSSYFFLHEDLSLGGSLLAVVIVLALLGSVVTCGVTVSALVNSTLLAVTVLWLFLYGLGFALSLLPASLPTPDRVLNTLPYMLQGHYDLPSLGRLLSWALGASLGVALIGLVYFSRRGV